MTCNVGCTEKWIRIAFGVALLAVALWAPMATAWQVALGVFGGIAIITGAVRFTLWKLLGISTCSRERL